MPNPPDVVNILFTGVALTKQDGQNKGAHFYCDRRLATLARGGFLRREWACWFDVVRKQLRKLKTRNVQPETHGQDTLRDEPAFAPNRLFSLLFQIDRMR